MFYGLKSKHVDLIKISVFEAPLYSALFLFEKAENNDRLFLLTNNILTSSPVGYIKVLNKRRVARGQ